MADTGYEFIPSEKREEEEFHTHFMKRNLRVVDPEEVIVDNKHFYEVIVLLSPLNASEKLKYNKEDIPLERITRITSRDIVEENSFEVTGDQLVSYLGRTAKVEDGILSFDSQDMLMQNDKPMLRRIVLREYERVPMPSLSLDAQVNYLNATYRVGPEQGSHYDQHQASRALDNREEV
tara:strand:- start:11839 stop:12372 length:534 start_codon:yes stop_codon:yes gene_type:complete